MFDGDPSELNKRNFLAIPRAFFQGSRAGPKGTQRTQSDTLQINPGSFLDNFFAGVTRDFHSH